MGIVDKLKDLIHGDKEEGVSEGAKGKNSYFFSERKYFDDFEAIEALQVAKDRLFDVNSWSNIPAIGNSIFELHSNQGTPVVLKKLKKGDFIRIVLAGIMPESWVIVTDAKEGEDFAEFTVQPSHDPKEERREGVTEHFFQKDAKSIFRVQRKGNVLIAEEIGQDEIINNEGEEAGARKALNTVIATGGWAGFQRYQWEVITNYIVDIE